MDKFNGFSALFVFSFLFVFLFPKVLFSQTEDTTVISTEVVEHTVSYSDITKKAFIDTARSTIRSADTTIITTNEPWVEKKRTVTVNSEIMAMEPFRLNMFPDHQYALIPDKFKYPQRDDAMIIKSVSGTIIDSGNTTIGKGAVFYANKDNKVAYSASFKLNNNKVFDISTNENDRVELKEFKDGESPPIFCSGIEDEDILEIDREDLTTSFSFSKGAFFINTFSDTSNFCQESEYESSHTRTYTNTSENNLTNLEIRVEIQSSRIAPLRLGNADFEDGSIDILEFPLTGNYEDEILSPNETVSVEYIFCHERNFNMYYLFHENIYGTIEN